MATVTVANTQVLSVSTSGEFTDLVSWLDTNGYQASDPGVASRDDDSQALTVTIVHDSFEWECA